jgi:ankyrin repeat protein
MVDKHQIENEERSADKIVRMHYENAIRGTEHPANEIKDDFELLEAARAGDDNKTRELLLRSLNTPDDTTKAQGRTVLHLAAQGGYEALARMLLENGADMQQKSSSGQTAFFMAIKAGHTAVVKVFLENGASVHERSNKISGVTPLAMALRHRHKDIVKLLIEHESVSEKIAPSSDALISAIKTHQEDIVVLLLESGADVNQKLTTGASYAKGTALHAAVITGPTMTKLILGAHGDLEAKYWDWTPLMYSLILIRVFKVEVVRLLVEAGAVISPEIWENFTPELRETYADRCPIRSLGLAEFPPEELSFINEECSIDEELDIDDVWDFDKDEGEDGGLQRDNMPYSSFLMPHHLGVSDDGIEAGPHWDENMEEDYE